ncbi:phosphopentomutase [Sneathiella chungangensis]|uniref:Phosphopentomutase n=1 Tax=Sneathiella chungangensis TaxID=1418234 RepID=A0A845MD90_9PROT|nr:phosphopentomutase [Sneathiella chungangensis]MZR22003.1 phosphopentomutase [Sneathiella chungangensis]
MRAILIVLDSFGLGAARDADVFGDVGADTFGHILEAAALGRADAAGRSGPLNLPNLRSLGLFAAHDEYHGKPGDRRSYTGLYGIAQERSKGKDTPSGHWEMAGVPVMFDWGYFPRTIPCFPKDLTDALIDRGNLPGILGNCHASGTEIIERLGVEHMESGKPILYTSADSVLQIAAHEETFGLDRLYALCDVSRGLVDPLGIGRVIARPFIGTAGQFTRTANRKDLAVPPPEPTLLDQLTAAGRQVISIGKIGDIFAHQGTGEIVKAAGNMALTDATIDAIARAEDGSLVFTNLVDFDQSYGHRRDVAGYARALEEFDARLPDLMARLKDGDIVILSADHGCDPTWEGTDHTREVVPIIAFGPGIPGGPIGERDSFADIGQSITSHLGLPPLAHGKSFLG